MAIGTSLLGGLIGAGGNIAGGLLAADGMGVSSGDIINSYYNPSLDAALQGSNFDLLSQIGLSNINNIPDPIQQLIGRIEQLPLEERMKRRAINFLPKAISRQEKGKDPFDMRRGQAVKNTLRRMGIDATGLQNLVDQRSQQQEQIQALRDAGLGGIQTDVILNRANTARTASELLGGAADFVRTGQPGNPLTQDLFARDERQLADLQDRFGVLANFGGMNQAQFAEAITDARLDQNLRLIEQQLGMSSALSNALRGGSAAGSQAASQSSGNSLNAAQIAAQQAMASNSLRAQMNANQALSIGNGISSGASALGSAVSNSGLLSQLGQILGGSQQTQSAYTAGLDFSGPGSSGNQYATMNANAQSGNSGGLGGLLSLFGYGG